MRWSSQARNYPKSGHCKPWRDTTNEERLNGENGLLLTPSIDHLFDRGFISFEDNGALIISPVAHRPSLERMGIDTARASNVGGFTSGQKQFLTGTASSGEKYGLGGSKTE
jgi:hypothetical protein